MYQYNTQNPAAQLLQKFALELAGQEAQKIADQQIAKEEAAKRAQRAKIQTVQTAQK
jgi:hypothetical protein